jgi:hypothetical protein
LPVPTSDPLVGFEKLTEGPHGFPPAVALPAEIGVYYSVKGTCTFTIEIHRADATGRLERNLSIEVKGAVSDVWYVKLQPTSYEVIAGEAVGCTYSIEVYPA